MVFGGKILYFSPEKFNFRRNILKLNFAGKLEIELRGEILRENVEILRENLENFV